MPSKFKIIILASDDSLVLRALFERAKNYDVLAVICSQELPSVQTFGKLNKIPVITITEKDFGSIESQKKALFEASLSFGADLVCLSSFELRIDERFLEFHRGAVVNLHPSLLPLFPNRYPHREVLKANAKEHGCTVYYVNKWLGTGPLIAQASFLCNNRMNEQILISQVEKRAIELYPWVVSYIAIGRIFLQEGDFVRYADTVISEAEKLNFRLLIN